MARLFLGATCCACGPTEKEEAPLGDGDRGGSAAAASAPFHFVDASAEAGLDFTNVSGTPAQDYVLESMSTGAAFLDYDGDGFQDLVLACADNRSGFVSVAFGSGKFNRGHYFARSQQYYLGKNPRSVVVEDLNGDGGTDMAVVRLGANDVTILRGVAK